MFRSARLRTVLIALGGVALLAAVIFAVPALQPARWGGSGEEQGRGPILPLAERARDALRSGDTTEALRLATEALDANPDDQLARRIATEVREQRSSGAGSSAGASGATSSPEATRKPTPVAPDSAFEKKLRDFGALLPESHPGFSLGTTVISDGEASVSGTPVDDTGQVSAIQWAIHERSSASAAQSFIAKTSRVLYAFDVGSLSVDGATAYAGTDGTRYASIVYTRGRYVFEVVVSGTDGNPGGYRDEALAAAQAFGDAPPK